MTPSALTVVRLEVPFGEAPGLHDIGFAVAPGERLVLLGASGAGKTTLLRAIAGLSPLGGGQVIIGGQDVTSIPAERRDAVYLHQTPLLFPHLSVFENVAFPLRIRGKPEETVWRSVDELLGSVRLEGLAGRRPHALSGGQKHRVALARAMAARPAVLLLDEPLTGLDPELREEVRTTLVSLQARTRLALVIVTHDLEDAAILGDRIGVLLDRTLVQLDSPERIFRRPASLAVARFLGIPNLVAGTVTGGRFCSPLGVLAAETARLEGPATAAFGADALHLHPRGSLRGIVRGVQHGPRDVTLRVDIAGLELLASAVPGGVPQPGEEHGFALAPDRVTILPGGSDV
ncbi:MAG: ABC transporter ATP-binding protein [Gemmatimonadales bacterium]